MIPVLNSEQIRSADQHTIEKLNIDFIQLMEQAGEAATEWILEKYPLQKDFIVICGKGNNGGDGLVIARLLAEKSRQVKVIIIEEAGKETAAFKRNYELLKNQSKTDINTIGVADQLEDVSSDFVLVECLFGNGINRAPEGLPLEVIRWINRQDAIVISIDVPAGMLPSVLTAEGTCVKADQTLCFEVPRLPFFFAETGRYCGDWHILKIGIDPESISSQKGKIFLAEPEDLRYWIKPRNEFSYKNNFGHALLLAGAAGKCGAAILTATACLRAGAGLVTIKTPQCCKDAIHSSIPEAMVIADAGNDYIEVPAFPLEFDTIGAGPGIGTNKETGNVLKRLFQDYKSGLVLDADAINLLSQNKTWLSFLPPETILTPHLGEFRRLAGDISDPFMRLEAQKEISSKYHCYIVLKGRYTMISCPDGSVIINPTGNPGMATAGAGDVLTGIITALRAQKFSPVAATVSGVYLHGRAGDLAAENNGQTGMIASDIIRYLPAAFSEVLS